MVEHLLAALAGAELDDCLIEVDGPEPPVLDGDAPAGIIYTSGTTGASKGAVLTHNNFAANAITLLTCWQISAADRFLLALPLFHIHALGNGLHCWLVSGCRMRLLERFDYRTAANEFLDFRPTLFFGNNLSRTTATIELVSGRPAGLPETVGVARSAAK